MGQSASCRVLVAGGGPAGLASAIALAERDIDVLVVDSGVPDGIKSRCEMLPEAAREIITRLGLASVIDEAAPLEGVLNLWGSASAVDHAKLMPGIGGFGWSVDRSKLDSAMHLRASNLGIRQHRGRVRHVGGYPGEWLVSVSGLGETRATYLVDATGRPAVLARRLGAKSVFGPDLLAVTFNVDCPVRPNLLAEATPEGWWYALPRDGNGGSAGFLTAKVDTNDLPDFMENAGIGLRLVPGPERCSGRSIKYHVSDSRSSRLSQITGKGWLATGDAAAAFDPVASQGLFNALSGGFFAGNAAADSVAGDPDAADIYALLVQRTADRTHGMIPRQYAAQPFDTPFWKNSARAGFG